MPNPRISVYFIVFNEEAHIREALESVVWADEIVVVDSGSTDHTVEICKEYTDRVYFHPWEGFAPQKAWALDQTRGEWVLNLDADERVTPALRDEIQKVLAEPGPYQGYYLPRKNFFGGQWIRYGGWYPDHVLRLFRREKGHYPDRLVHERVVVDGEVGYLRAPLEHYTYRDVGDYLLRLHRYTDLAARQMLREGRRGRSFDLIARPLFTFWEKYMLRQGFRDGNVGLILAGLQAFYVFSKFARLMELQEQMQKTDRNV